MNKHDLINSHMWLAEMLAKKKKRSVSRMIYYEDLKSAAYYGLVDAANKYDNRVPFKNYASFRILGEMDDYVRELKWGPVHGDHLKIYPLSNDIIGKNKEIEDKSDLMEYILRNLPDKVKWIFSMYYQDGLVMKEIGKRLGICESAVSRIMSKYNIELNKKRDEIFIRFGLV